MAVKRRFQLEVDRKKRRTILSGQSDSSFRRVQSLVQRNEKCRRQLLIKLYCSTGGNAEVTKRLEFLDTSCKSLKHVLTAARHLAREGLVMVEKRTESSPYFLGLTHKGVKTVEHLANECTEVDVPLPPITLNTFESVVGPVQIGPHTSSTTTQTIGFDADQVLRLIAGLQKGLSTLPTKELRRLSEVVEALNKETRSAEPDKSKLNALVSQLGYFAVRSGAEKFITEIFQRLVRTIE